MRILVVDDNKTLQEIIQVFLVRAGWEVVLTKDGDEALKLYRRKGPFDAVVTDLVHPGLDGLQLSGAIRKRTPTRPS